MSLRYEFFPLPGKEGPRGMVEQVFGAAKSFENPPLLSYNRGEESIRGAEPLADTLVVYTHPECTYSDALKEELDDIGAEYEEINLAVHPDSWAALEELTGGERITPVTVEGELVTIGFHGVG